MTLNEQARHAILNFHYSTALFESFRREQLELSSWARTRTLRMIWRRALLSRSLLNSQLKTSRTLSRSSFKSTVPTSDYQHQVTVICQRGPDKESFSGTRYRVVNQVNLYLTTGMSGDTLQKKSSTELMDLVALSSYASAILRRRSSTTSTEKEIALFAHRTHHHEGIVSARAPSQEVGFSLKSIDIWSNSGEKK